MHSRRETCYVWRLLAVAVVISITGCASAYHDYAGCCVPYQYCSSPPLPYAAYEGCHCPTPGAALYYQQRNEAGVDVAPSKEAPSDAPAP